VAPKLLENLYTSVLEGSSLFGRRTG